MLVAVDDLEDEVDAVELSVEWMCAVDMISCALDRDDGRVMVTVRLTVADMMAAAVFGNDPELAVRKLSDVTL